MFCKRDLIMQLPGFSCWIFRGMPISLRAFFKQMGGKLVRLTCMRTPLSGFMHDVFGCRSFVSVLIGVPITEICHISCSQEAADFQMVGRTALFSSAPRDLLYSSDPHQQHCMNEHVKVAQVFFLLREKISILSKTSKAFNFFQVFWCVVTSAYTVQ